MPPADVLVLFDIDGTLIGKAGPHHREALVAAVRRATGIETNNDQLPTQGMLDRDILAVMLRNAGASRALIREKMPEIVRCAQNGAPKTWMRGLAQTWKARFVPEFECCFGG